VVVADLLAELSLLGERSGLIEAQFVHDTDGCCRLVTMNMQEVFIPASVTG